MDLSGNRLTCANELRNFAQDAIRCQTDIVIQNCKLAARLGMFSFTVTLPRDGQTVVLDHLRRHMPGCQLYVSAAADYLTISWN